MGEEGEEDSQSWRGTVKRAGDFGKFRVGSKARERCVEDETCGERPTGASLLCLKEICTRKTITYKYTARDLQNSQQSILK